MWLYTVFGFFSVVEHRDDKDLLIVRSRFKGDLEKLKTKYLPNLGEIVYMPTADYPHRALAWKEELAEAAKKAVLDITYPNFKSEVSKQQGQERHDLYMDVWSVMKHARSKLAEAKRQIERLGKDSKSWLDSWSQRGVFRDVREIEESPRRARLKVVNSKEDEEDAEVIDALAYSYGDDIIAEKEAYWCPKCSLFGGHRKGCTYKIGVK